jgi:hypothetical protein
MVCGATKANDVLLGLIEEFTFEKSGGKGARQPVKGYRRVPR